MLPNWSAYFDSKTGTQSFYEVDYRVITLKCGPSLTDNYSFSSLKSATNTSNPTLKEFKGQFEAMLKIIKESITQQQPWNDIKKVVKVIDNIVAYTYIEGAYVKKVQMDAKDLQISPSFSFTIQRLVRLAKDLHLLCIYAKKKETEEFKETRRVLKETVRSVRKSALQFLKTYSTKQDQQSIDPVREILMAQFLQLVKFLVNFTKFEDHQAYVTYCSSGSTTKDLPDIWKMTDCSVRQATNGASSIMIDSRDNITSLMRIPSQGRNSIVSTVHELCSLGDLLVKKRDFTHGSTKSHQEYKGSIGDLEGLGDSILGFGKQKGFRRRTADEQDRPDSRLLKETQKLYGNRNEMDGTKGPKRSNSLAVPSQFSRNDQMNGAKEGSDANFVIEEQSGEASPKKCCTRKLEMDDVEEKVKNVLKHLHEEKSEPKSHDEPQNEDKLDKKNTENDQEIKSDRKREEENYMPQKEKIIEASHSQEVTLAGAVVPEEIVNTPELGPEKKVIPVINITGAEENNNNPVTEDVNPKIAQFKRKLRAVSVGRNALLQLVLTNESPNVVESHELTPVARTERRHNTIVAHVNRSNHEIETAGLPLPRQEKIIPETAALKIPESRKSSPSPVRKRRSSSLDSLPKRPQAREKRPHRKSGGYKKPEEDFSFHPLPQPERRKQFLEKTFGVKNKIGVERSMQDGYGLFHQKYERIYKERVYDIRRTTEIGKRRLACIPYVIPESWIFLEKHRDVRTQEAKESSSKVVKNRVLELWEKVRQAVKLKTFLWKMGYKRNTEFPSYNQRDGDLLKCLSKSSKGNLKFFRYTPKKSQEVRYLGPVRKMREVKHLDMYNGSFIPEEDRDCEDDFYALETSLMLARLGYGRKGLWGAAFSFKGKGYPSIDSRSKDASRDVSRDISRDVSREDSRDNSGSGISSTKRGSILKALFNTSAENSIILSPSNRSMSEGKDQSWSASKSKPSLFKSLLRLHPVNEPSSASPRTTRSRASSKTSLKDFINNSCSSSPRGTNGPLSCPKRPSLFKTLFKSSANPKENDSQRSGRSSREPTTPASAGWKTSRD